MAIHEFHPAIPPAWLPAEFRGNVRYALRGTINVDAISSARTKLGANIVEPDSRVVPANTNLLFELENQPAELAQFVARAVTVGDFQLFRVTPSGVPLFIRPLSDTSGESVQVEDDCDPRGDGNHDDTGQLEWLLADPRFPNARD